MENQSNEIMKWGKINALCVRAYVCVCACVRARACVCVCVCTAETNEFQTHSFSINSFIYR